MCWYLDEEERVRVIKGIRKLANGCLRPRNYGLPDDRIKAGGTQRERAIGFPPSHFPMSDPPPSLLCNCAIIHAQRSGFWSLTERVGFGGARQGTGCTFSRCDNSRGILHTWYCPLYAYGIKNWEWFYFMGIFIGNCNIHPQVLWRCTDVQKLAGQKL